MIAEDDGAEFEMRQINCLIPEGSHYLTWNNGDVYFSYRRVGVGVEMHLGVSRGHAKDALRACRDAIQWATDKGYAGICTFVTEDARSIYNMLKRLDFEQVFKGDATMVDGSTQKVIAMVRIF